MNTAVQRTVEQESKLVRQLDGGGVEMYTSSVMVVVACLMAMAAAKQTAADA